MKRRSADVWGQSDSLDTLYLSASPALLSCQAGCDNKSSVVLKPHDVLQIAAGKTLSEVEVDEFLTGRRAAQGGFIEPSFPTIAGSGPHGAIIHYRAQPESAGTVSAQQLLLVDSGTLQSTCFMICNSFIDSARPLVVFGMAVISDDFKTTNQCLPENKSSNSQNFLSDLCRRPV